MILWGSNHTNSDSGLLTVWVEFAYQVRTVHLFKGADDLLLITPVMPEEELSLSIFLFLSDGGVDRFESVGMKAGIVDLGGKGHG